MTKNKFTAVILGFFLITFLWIRTESVHAATSVNAFCQPDQTVFEKVGSALRALDVRKTVVNMLTSGLTDLVIVLISNRNVTQMVECSYFILNQNVKYQGAAAEMLQQCPAVATPSTNCEDLLLMYNGNSFGSNNEGGLAFNQTLTSGSMIGIANAVEGSARYEPLPTNLAYFWNDSIKNVPFAGKAFAADISYSNAPMIGFILSLWKTFRNIAFGMLAIVMLVIGIMIMIRKQLAPQLSVTLQYALPKIPLAIVLIAFSYTIGAVLASSMRYLADISTAVIGSVAMTEIGGGDGTWPPSIGSIISLLLSFIMRAAGPGLMLVTTTVLFLGIIVALYIFVWIRAFLIYIKFIFSIVFSPIIFALGAIPGNESMTSNWFKQALVSVLSYAGMFAYINVVLLIVLLMLLAPTNYLSVSGVLGSIFGALLGPIIIIFGLIQALKVPGKVSALIMGDPKTGKRR